MRILWVKMGGLWPSTTGGRVRSLQILSRLSARHQVTLVTTHGSGDDPEGLARQLPLCRVTSIPYVVPKRGSARFPVAVASSWLSSLPVDLWKWRVGAVRDHVRALLANGCADLCVADFLFAVPNVPLRDEQKAELKLGATNRRVPVVLFEHNVEYLIWQRLASLETQPLRKVLFELEWRKLRQREAMACVQADLTIAVSDQDRRRLAKLAPSARFATIPTGVDTSYFKPNRGREIPARLVFTGSMDWHPNEDAVIHFSEAILPRIRAHVPDVSFTVVGRNPSARLREIAARAGIAVTGTVDDVRPYIDEAALYVVPLRAGSGTRLKIFEALAMGKAVVSTTVGAEGLSVTPGRDIVLADEPDGFATSVIALLQDPAQRQMLGQTGRTLVETHYSWEQVTGDFEAHCGSVVAEYEDTRDAADRRAHLSRTGPPRHRGAGFVAGEHDELGWRHPHS